MTGTPSSPAPDLAAEIARLQVLYDAPAPAADLAEVQSRLAAARGALEAFGVRRIVVFGSFARGEVRGGSDVDLALDVDAHFQPRDITFIDWANDLRGFLERRLGRPVDICWLPPLRPEIAAAVAAEGVEVASW